MLKDVKETAAWERSKGEFSVIEVPAVIVSIETFVSLQKDAETILDSDGASVLLYEAGKKAGLRWINRFSRKWGLKDKNFIEAVQNFYAEWDGAGSAWKKIAMMSLLSGLRIHLLQEDMGIQKFLSAIS